MKFNSFLATMAIAGAVSICELPIQMINPWLIQASAQSLSFKEQIELININKDKIGSGDQLRRFFFGDLEPISVQPGGAGMIVNLYNKANDYTFAYCATFDVVVNFKKGRISAFAPSEVK